MIRVSAGIVVSEVYLRPVGSVDADIERERVTAREHTVLHAYRTFRISLIAACV